MGGLVDEIACSVDSISPFNKPRAKCQDRVIADIFIIGDRDSASTVAECAASMVFRLGVQVHLAFDFSKVLVEHFRRSGSAAFSPRRQKIRRADRW